MPLQQLDDILHCHARLPVTHMPGLDGRRMRHIANRENVVIVWMIQLQCRLDLERALVAKETRFPARDELVVVMLADAEDLGRVSTAEPPST